MALTLWIVSKNTILDWLAFSAPKERYRVAWGASPRTWLALGVGAPVGATSIERRLLSPLPGLAMEMVIASRDSRPWLHDAAAPRLKCGSPLVATRPRLQATGATLDRSRRPDQFTHLASFFFACS